MRDATVRDSPAPACWATPSSASVVPAIAETTTTVGSWAWRRMMSTAWRTAAESASDAPPNLCT